MDNPGARTAKQQPDHRRIGQELDLFVFSELVGSGLPLWTPRGTVLREELDRFVQEMRNEHGFQAVTIPHITRDELYKKSGHWAKFNDDLFRIVSREKHEFAMKPMNCPHHTQIYASKPRSYRDLPIRYRETTMNYRDEQSGELNGLLRTRAFTQDDAHVFCREEDIVNETLSIWDVIERFYGKFNFKLSTRFSKRDPNTPKAYAGSEENWKKAEEELQKAIDKKSVKVADGIGDAAFYGPKLDFIARDSLEREWQVATIQLDFAQPEGLGLTYTNTHGKEQKPVMIHCAIMGSIERFLAVYLEHTDGILPLWLAPEQLRVVTLNDDREVIRKTYEVLDKAQRLGLRTELDNSNESVGRKIRDAEVMKVPYSLVIGAKEIESGMFTPRNRSDLPELPGLSADKLLELLSQDAKSRK